MTDIRDRSGLIARWRATVDALEGVVLAAADEPEIDATEADEVRRLVMVRTARRRRNTLPAAWMRRPGALTQIVPDDRHARGATASDEPTPRPPHVPARPRLAWHE
jgi:hypothetical protein